MGWANCWEHPDDDRRLTNRAGLVIGSLALMGILGVLMMATIQKAREDDVMGRMWGRRGGARYGGGGGYQWTIQFESIQIAKSYSDKSLTATIVFDSSEDRHEMKVFEDLVPIDEAEKEKAQPGAAALDETIIQLKNSSEEYTAQLIVLVKNKSTKDEKKIEGKPVQLPGSDGGHLTLMAKPAIRELAINMVPVVSTEEPTSIGTEEGEDATTEGDEAGNIEKSEEKGNTRRAGNKADERQEDEDKSEKKNTDQKDAEDHEEDHVTRKTTIDKNEDDKGWSTVRLTNRPTTRVTGFGPLLKSTPKKSLKAYRQKQPQQSIGNMRIEGREMEKDEKADHDEGRERTVLDEWENGDEEEREGSLLNDDWVNK